MALVTPTHIGRQPQPQQYLQQLQQHLQQLHALQQVQQRHGPARTNKRTRVAISRLQRAMPEHEDTVLLMLFGSRARGDYRRGSDIDLLHIVKGNCNRWDQKHFDIVRRSIGDAWTTAAAAIKQINVMVETTRSVKKRWNLYGMMEYWAMAEGVVIYGRQPHADRLLSQYRAITDQEASRRWLELSKRHIGEGTSYSKKYNGGAPDIHFTCFMMYRAIEDAVKSILLYHGIRFHFTRILDDMCGLLPDGPAAAAINAWDTERIQDWWERRWKPQPRRRPPGASYDMADYDYAVAAAQDIYDAAASITGNG